MISNFSEASIIVLLWTVRSSMAFENLLVNCWMFIIVLIGVYKDGLHRFFCVFFFTRHQILAKYKLFFYTAWLVRTRWRFIIPHFLYSPSLILFSFWFSFQLSFYSSPPPTAILLPSLTPSLTILSLTRGQRISFFHLLASQETICIFACLLQKLDFFSIHHYTFSWLNSPYCLF